MVILQLSLPNPQTNGAITGLTSICQKRSSKFHSTLPPRLLISNSHESQYPISHQVQILSLKTFNDFPDFFSLHYHIHS